MLYTSDGHKIEQRQQLPQGNVHLKNGRILRYKGPFVAPESGVWQCEGATPAEGFRVLASLDETPHGRLLHVSMSYQDHDPTWSEIREVREAFFSQEIDCMMLLPKKADEHTFHAWQTPVEWGVL